MSERLEELERKFKENIDVFLDICEDLIREGQKHSLTDLQPSYMNMIKMFINTKDRKVMMNTFIEGSYEDWDKIRNKDIEYFKEKGFQLFMKEEKEKSLDKSEGVFGTLGTNTLKKFKELLQKKYIVNGKEVPIFSDEIANEIFEIAIGCVKLSICWIHHMREPVSKKYTKKFHTDIKINECVKTWEIKKL